MSSSALRPGRTTALVTQAAKLLVLLLATVVTLYPFLWMLFGSLKSQGEVYQNIWGPPLSPVFANYVEAWKLAGIGMSVVNSVAVTGFSIALILVLSSMSAYAFAKIDFPGRTVLFALYLGALMVPAAVLIIPLFILMRNLHLLNTRLSLVLAYSSTRLAFSVFLLRAYFSSFPHELEDAALCDGATRWRILWRIIVPLSRAGLVTVAIVQGLAVWNDVLLPLVLVRKNNMRTIPLGILQFFQEYRIEWGLLFAALCITVLPVLVIYVLCQRQFIAGMTDGALKS